MIESSTLLQYVWLNEFESVFVKLNEFLSHLRILSKLVKYELLQLYIIIINQDISLTFVNEIKGERKSICFELGSLWVET